MIYCYLQEHVDRFQQMAETLQTAMEVAMADQSIQGMVQRCATALSLLGELQGKLGEKQRWLPHYRRTLEPTLEGPCPQPT